MNSKTKEAKPTHTPGRVSFCDAEPEDYGQTAKVKLCRYDAKGRAVYSWERIPTATLAAAPDLLAALQQFAAVFEHTDIRDMNTPTYQALDNARAAILRATTGGK